MSSPCAQVSMIRADAVVPAPIGGPSHVSRVPEGTSASACCTAARPPRHRCRTWGVGRPTAAAAPDSIAAGRSATMFGRAARNFPGSRQACTVSSSAQFR